MLSRIIPSTASLAAATRLAPKSTEFLRSRPAVVVCSRPRGRASMPAMAVSDDHVQRCPFQASEPDVRPEAPSRDTTDTLRPEHDIPGPRSLPFIGTMHKYLPVVGSYSMRDQQTTDERRCREFGSLVREERFPGVVMYYIYDPDLIREALLQEDRIPSRFQMPGVAEYRKDRGQHPGFCNSEGDQLWRIRRVANNLLMRPSKVASYVSRQLPVTDDLVKYIAEHKNDEGEVHSLLSIFYRWGMECVGTLIFDTRLGTLHNVDDVTTEGSRFVSAANDAFDTMYDTTFFWPLHSRKNTKTWRRLVAGLDFIWSTLMKHSNRRLGEAKSGEDIDGSLLLAVLTQSGLERNEALALLGDLFYAGVDTVAHALAFNLYQLSKNPDVQAELQREVDRLAPAGSEVTSEVLGQARYLKAIIKETFRMHPVSAFGVARTFQNEIHVGGYKLPAGSICFMNPNVAAMSEEHFAEPEVFRPERWLREARSDIHPYSVLPFGHGLRMCPGKRVAEQQIQVALFKIAQSFLVDYKHGSMGMTTRFTNLPDKPLKFSFTSRH